MRKTIKYKGVDVVYSHNGSGQTIVLLHGFLEERGMWNEFVEKLSACFEVLAIDLLGQGETGNLGYIHSMEEHAAAVEKVLVTEKVDNCIVIGHSMGGYVALALAEKLSTIFTKLILLHSTSFADSAEKRKERERVIGLVKRNKSIYVQAVIPSLFSEATKTNFKGEIEHLTKVATEFTKHGIIANIRGMMERKDRSEILRNGTFKTLIIHGTQDPVIQTADVTTQSNLSDNVELKLIEGAGHMSHLELPEQCFAAILDFCKI